MNGPILDVKTALDALGAAIRAVDASAINSASEQLSVAVKALSASPMNHPGGAESHALAELQAQLETVSIEVNLHSGWTRRRIDSLADIRGQRRLAEQKYC